MQLDTKLSHHRTKADIYIYIGILKLISAEEVYREKS
jgi:hypothetical protein